MSRIVPTKAPAVVDAADAVCLVDPATGAALSALPVGAGANIIGALTPAAAGTGGGNNLLLGRLVSAASTNGTNFKASNARLFGGVVINTNAAVRYLKIYNLSAAPTSASTPDFTILVPPNSVVGLTQVVPEALGYRMASGLGVFTTTGAADSDNTAVGAGDLIVSLLYV